MAKDYYSFDKKKKSWQREELELIDLRGKKKIDLEDFIWENPSFILVDSMKTLWHFDMLISNKDGSWELFGAKIVCLCKEKHG